MHRNTWKRAESTVAKVFGTTRTPLSGSNSKHTSSDTLSETVYVEVKIFKSKRSLYKKLWDIYKAHGCSFIQHKSGITYAVFSLEDVLNNKEFASISIDNIKRGTRFALWQAMEDVVKSAHVEYKIPLLAVRQYRRSNIVFMCRAEDKDKIWQEIWRYNGKTYQE